MRTLKWVYKLGYKHAETKLYHTLRDRIHRNAPTEIDMFDFEQKSNSDKRNLEFREEVAHRLFKIVEDVFKPQVPINYDAPQTKNRFED